MTHARDWDRARERDELRRKDDPALAPTSSRQARYLNGKHSAERERVLRALDRDRAGAGEQTERQRPEATEGR